MTKYIFRHVVLFTGFDQEQESPCDCSPIIDQMEGSRLDLKQIKPLSLDQRTFPVLIQPLRIKTRAGRETFA